MVRSDFNLEGIHAAVFGSAKVRQLNRTGVLDDWDGIERFKEQGAECYGSSVHCEVSGKCPLLVLVARTVFATGSSIDCCLFPLTNFALECLGNDLLSCVNGAQIELPGAKG